MTKLIGIRIRCVPCGASFPLESIDGEVFDPPGWTKRGFDTICPACNKKHAVANLHPEVQLAAEKVVHTIQALIATELSFQPEPGQSIVIGSDGMSRRMKRCELLSKYADVIMTVYGNIVGFRLAERGAFGRTTLHDVCLACENLLKAEIAFSEARAAKPPHTPNSGLQGTFSRRTEYGEWNTEYDDGPNIAGPLFRFQEIAKVAQKLAQLVATRAGEFAVTAEDKIIADAVEGVANGRIGGYGGILGGGGTDTESIQRQFMMMIQKFMEKQVDKQNEAEARIAARDKISPVDELEQLLDIRTKLKAANRGTSAIDAKITAIEAQINQETQQDIVESAINAESVAKDITPRQIKDHHTAPPPDEDEIEHLRKSIGDEAVRIAFPVEFELAVRAAALHKDENEAVE